MIDHKLFRDYFEYSSPSNMYKNLNKITNKEKNRDQVNMIKNSITNLMEELKKRPTSNAIKIKNRNSMVEIVERIFFL